MDGGAFSSDMDKPAMAESTLVSGADMLDDRVNDR